MGEDRAPATCVGVVFLQLVTRFAMARTKANVNHQRPLRERTPNPSFPWHRAHLFIAASHALDAALLQHRRPLVCCLRIGAQSSRPNIVSSKRNTVSIVFRAELLRGRPGEARISIRQNRAFLLAGLGFGLALARDDLFFLAVFWRRQRNDHYRAIRRAIGSADGSESGTGRASDVSSCSMTVRDWQSAPRRSQSGKCRRRSQRRRSKRPERPARGCCRD
jgi:hypothetical protein